MSKVNTTILQDIESILDDIESVLIVFQSNELSEEDTVEKRHQPLPASIIQKGIRRTSSIYILVQDAGAFPVVNHSTNTKDAMSKWAVVIDNLHWSVFGCEYNSNILENNKMRIILSKLKHIKTQLYEYVPTRC
jgi:hypothetical protein